MPRKKKPTTETVPYQAGQVSRYLNSWGSLGLKNPIHQFILKYGKNYYPDENTFTGKKGQQKMCYMNAGRMALFSDHLIYCEGYVVTMGIPIEHAWCIDTKNNNAVIDPTLREGNNRVSEYFGVAFKQDWLRKFIFKAKYWGVFGYMSHKTWLESDPDSGVYKT